MYLILLISLLVTTQVYGDISGLNLSGFAYTTLFQDNDWFDNDSRVAVNFATDFDHVNLLGQIDTQKSQPRRLAIEYAAPLSDKTSVKFNFGRMVRLDGFYNNVTDSPASHGMSMLPLAIYSRRMLTGTFMLLDGASISGTTKNDGTLMEYGIRFGAPYIDSNEYLQKEAFRTYASNAQYVRRYNNYDLYYQISIEDHSLLLSINHYSIDFNNRNPADKLSSYIAANAARINFDTAKIGYIYDFGRYRFTTEYHYGKTELLSDADKVSAYIKAHSIYGMLGYSISDECEIYSLYNYGRSENTGSQVKDFASGISFDFGRYFFNLEYHDGSSNHGTWVKYDAPSGKHTWQSLVVSAALRF